MKNALRKEIAARIKALSEEYKTAADAAMLEQLFLLPDYQKARTVFTYVSIEGEPDTRRFIEHALSEGKRVGVPLCISRGIMEVREMKCWEDLEPGMWDIPEPKKSCPVIPREELEFAIIPCATCNTSGQRLGHGAGFYDRFLSTEASLNDPAAPLPFPAAMVCYEKILCSHIPTEPHDRIIPMVVTEQNVYK